MHIVTRAYLPPLFEKSGVQPGATMLVQGAGGGVATAFIVIGRAAGYRMWATSRSEAKRERALSDAQVRRRSAAHLVSWWRLDSWSLRSTDDTWLSTVFTEMYSSRAISLYV